jgi:hypothetical protein
MEVPTLAVQLEDPTRRCRLLVRLPLCRPDPPARPARGCWNSSGRSRTRGPVVADSHDLSAIPAIGLGAVIAGARSFVAIGQWVAHQPVQAVRALGLTTPAGPDGSRTRGVFAPIDADVLDKVLGAFMWTPTHTIGTPRVIALDGRTVRGARSKNKAAPHLVAALDHAGGVVVGQLAITARSNEIPAVRGS